MDLHYLSECYIEAKHSPDPSTQNGCVIVKDNQIICYGYNDLPLGVTATKEQWADKDYKYPRVVHAEVSTICQAARFGRAIDKATLYGAWCACENCAKVIIESGISRVVGHKPIVDGVSLHDTHSNWSESIAIAKDLFDKAGVEFVELEGKLGQTIRFNGNKVEV